MAIGGQGSDPTLHLPRILCLHGGGTNARIFRMQCRAFKYHLGREFRFIFAQAPFPSKPGPDVTSVYSNYGPFRAWIRPVEEGEDLDLCATEASKLIQSSINTAIDADSHLGATGEVVGILGFSQGARIAASLLYNQQLRCQQLGNDSEKKAESTMGWPNFRFAVLLAGRGRLIWLTPDAPMPEGLVPPLQPAGMPPLMLDDAVSWDGLHIQNKLQLPTVHVHGVKDIGLEFHRQLAKCYCVPDSSTVIEWEGEHRVPIKTKDVFPVASQMLRLAR
ncbi:serine hydrolase (FSH1) domain-containing protein [Hirsutella rhossiliensis]|uniref:Serine hydrolase (FSH1) domain-containing protein n=1 Tax=Hirsutella rhossiliensis TaxID=111463 RepID=A0A9P8N1Y0_9HYPO|nr:serine hydrolase (FSH1) domain-containing protein [Hirsutella rhossiliensis]KAH0966148.1 serine hydrolase (FSH1) domain-containing protein [Hirsutella rhossiliensis]